MKKVLFILIFLFIPSLVLAQDICPFGMVNDTSPGSCIRYEDNNGNDICDLSEIPLAIDSNNQTETVSEQSLKEMTVAEMAKTYQVNAGDFAQALSKNLGITIKATDSMIDLHDNNGLCMGVAGSIAASLEKNNVSEKNSNNQNQNKKLSKYNFIPLTLILFIIYLFTYMLVKIKKIKLYTHRRIWNSVLLLSFLVAGILGILLVIRINYGFVINFPFNMLYWHVEAGIAMSVVTIFHIAWHWRYFLLLIKKNENK